MKFTFFVFYESLIIDDGGIGLPKVQRDWIRFACSESFNFFRACTFSWVFAHLLIFVSFCTCSPPNPVIHRIWSLNLLTIYLPLLINTVIFTFHIWNTNISFIIKRFTHWKHSLTMATSLASNCSPWALLTRHTSSNASLSSWDRKDWNEIGNIKWDREYWNEKGKIKDEIMRIGMR